MGSFLHRIQYRIPKLHLVDMVIVFTALLSISFVAYLFLRKGTYVTVTIKVGQDNVLYQPWKRDSGTTDWFSQQFRIGMKELDGFGKINAEVTDVFSYDSTPETRDVYLTVKIKTIYSRGSNQYTYRGKPVLTGSPIKMYLDKTLIDGLVTHIEGTKENKDYHKMILNARLIGYNFQFLDTDGVEPHLAEALMVGDTITDNQGRKIIVVRDKQVKPAARLVVTGGGKTIVGINPLLRDVSFTLEVYAVKYQNRYFIFNDVPVLIGQKIPIHTETVSLYPEITRVVSID